jgi:hypothetical protein
MIYTQVLLPVLLVLMVMKMMDEEGRVIKLHYLRRVDL